MYGLQNNTIVLKKVRQHQRDMFVQLAGIYDASGGWHRSPDDLKRDNFHRETVLTTAFQVRPELCMIVRCATGLLHM